MKLNYENNLGVQLPQFEASCLEKEVYPNL